MNSKTEGAGARACWFVGATFDGSEDQTPCFLQEGIWENGYEDKYLDAVKSIQVGDRIAIKSSYTRKHDLPFDNRRQIVSVMAIKAIGTVKQNLGDGRILNVAWKPFDPPREWYFYTYPRTVWRVLPGDWSTTP
jgi:5-methylcytosine-specific restriction enzyme B